MEKQKQLRRCATKLKRRSPFKRTIYAFFLLAAFGFSSCEERGCESPEPAGLCGTFATVEEEGCRDGALGRKWLRLDNGELLWPIKVSTTLPNLVHGQRIMIGYTKVSPDTANKYLCNYVMAPEEPDAAINITCIGGGIDKCGTRPSLCNTFVTAENVMCGGGAFGNTWFKLDDGTYLQPFEDLVTGVNLVAGKRYKIGYEKMTRDNRYNNQVICQAMPPAADPIRLTCIITEEMDMAGK